MQCVFCLIFNQLFHWFCRCISFDWLLFVQTANVILLTLSLLCCMSTHSPVIQIFLTACFLHSEFCALSIKLYLLYALLSLFELCIICCFFFSDPVSLQTKQKRYKQQCSTIYPQIRQFLIELIVKFLILIAHFYLDTIYYML